ncbi:MAG: MFS transporter [Kordiimonadaceae bacterium]|nr:MFS transporter [Kordiimonadaceae bacterium]
MLQLFKDRNFFTYWIGEFISVIGDHISMVAFPLLVLQMTGSVAMTGMVFAAQGLPRAILMLFGGAVVDRTSPRMVMLLTNLVRFLLVMLVAYLLYIDAINIPLVFTLAFLFGVADAFFYPANTAMVPSMVSKEKLKEANALVQGSIWIGVIVGPALAGLIIAQDITVLGHDVGQVAATYESNRLGFARAFFLDGLTFAASFMTLVFVRTRKLNSDAELGGEPGATAGNSMLGEVRQAIRWVWSQPTLRLGFLGVAGLEFFFQTPIFVGLPALAKARFIEPAYVFGLMITAYGCGALLGVSAAGYLREMKERTLVRIMFFAFMISGASFGLIVLYEPYWWAMTLFFLSGAGDSFVWVNFTTWVQKQTPEKFLGRVMSILTFMSVGLIPVASLILGWAFEWNLELSLMMVSCILVVGCVVAALHPDAIYRGPPKNVEPETM